MAEGVADNQIAQRGRAKIREGVVVSDKMTKTVVVAVSRRVEHSKYGKYVGHTKRYMAHNMLEGVKVGDLVKIRESRPLSKNKNWVVQEVVRKSE